MSLHKATDTYSLRRRAAVIEILAKHVARSFTGILGGPTVILALVELEEGRHGFLDSLCQLEGEAGLYAEQDGGEVKGGVAVEKVGEDARPSEAQ